MGYFEGFGVTIRQHRLFGGKRVTTEYSGGRRAKKKHNDARDVEHDEKLERPERLHGRHVLNRYEDGMEKCIGCELCAGVCPADCIHVRGADNDPVDPTSPGERFGWIYEINYLRCIHCDLCVEACPTEAITESKLFEFSFTNRQDAIYTKDELLVGDDGKPKKMPWEDWRAGDDLLTSGWMRATSPSGDATFEGQIGWSGELGYGVRAPEPTQDVRDASTRRQDGAEDRAVSDTTFLEYVVFFSAAVMILGGAIGVIILRNPVHAALGLVLTLFGVAVQFVAMEAHFLAAVQVIVYAGAIVVLFLFVIMLLGVDESIDLSIEPIPIQRPLAAIMGVGLVGLLGAAIVRAEDTLVINPGSGIDTAAETANNDANIQQLAANLYGDHVFAFQLTSVLLIVAVAGTVVLTRKWPRDAESSESSDA